MKKIFGGGSKKKDDLASDIGKVQLSDDDSSSPPTPTQPRKLDTGGLLMVRLVKARGLSGAELIGDKKIFCHIEYDKNELVVDADNVDLINPAFKHRSHFDVANADKEIQFTMWIKPSSGGKATMIGFHRTRPPLTEMRLFDEFVPLTLDDTTTVGELEVQMMYKRPDANKKLVMEDFDLLKVIGKGSFGKVMQVRKKDTMRIYAMKIIRKANIIERDEVEHTIAERNVLAQINHPFIVNLKFSFQTSEKLYFVLAFVNGGELFKHLQDDGQFDEYRAKFYTAELLLALELLHKFNIIYRDLKPENILLDYSGHIALCDFGLCKLHMTNGEKTNTFCGTPEYLAPELLIGEGYNKVVDWWTLGVLLYEMLTGLPPFYSEDTNEMYRKILHEELVFPPEVTPLARSLLTKLLERDPTKRLGANGAEEIRKDPFFADINWDKLMQRKIVPPFRPEVSSSTDTSNFDEEFTAQAPIDSVVESSQLSESIQEQFDGFTYVGDNKMTYAATPSMASMRVHPKGL